MFSHHNLKIADAATDFQSVFRVSLKEGREIKGI
jgi:hypothetical protein